MSDDKQPPRPRTTAVPYDHALRYFVPSRRQPKEPPYLVELDAYEGNGFCPCKHFEIRCEPLLRRGVPIAEALEKKLIRLKEGRHPEDIYRCEHILTARSQFCDDVIKAISQAEKKAKP